jgi:hypothetical protein
MVSLIGAEFLLAVFQTSCFIFGLSVSLFCAAQIRYTSYPDNYTTVLNNGIRVRFVPKGQLARFDFPTFALSMLSFVVLFGTVTTAMDIYARYFLCDPLLTRNFEMARKQEVCGAAMCRCLCFVPVLFSLLPCQHFPSFVVCVSICTLGLCLLALRPPCFEPLFLFGPELCSPEITDFLS